MGCPTPTLNAPQTLPQRLRFVSSGNGSATLEGAVRVPPGSYPVILQAVSSFGTTTQNFTLVVTAN